MLLSLGVNLRESSRVGTVSSWQMLTTPHGGEAVSQREEEAHSYRPSASLHCVEQEREQGRGMQTAPRERQLLDQSCSPTLATRSISYFFGCCDKTSWPKPTYGRKGLFRGEASEGESVMVGEA